ncbi:hypothetical protein MCERHM31_01332 [Methylophilaceae bacterium]
MPRAKTIQPPPLYSFSFYYGIVLIEVEVRDDTCYLISRGSHKRNAYEEKLWEVMEHVVTDYLSVNGKKFIPSDKDYLLSATNFATKIETLGFGGVNGEDNSALRKKLYYDVKHELSVFQSAIDEKIKNIGKGTSCAQNTK